MADLSVTIAENVTIGTTQYGEQTTVTIADIADVFQRQITVPTSEIVLYTTHASSVAGNTFDEDFVKYARFQNQSGNFITLTITGASGDDLHFVLFPNKSLMLWDHKAAIDTNRTCGETGFELALADISSITAEADTSAANLSIFVASTNA